eukprot:gene5080-6324_t
MNNNNMDQRTKELEVMLNEFFKLDGNDPKRNQLDTFLTQYKSQKDSYEHVRYYLQHSSDQYVQWFSMSILEEKVCKSWSTLSAQDQLDLKKMLFDLYLHNTTFSSYIITKLGQVLADIGRIEFLPITSQSYIQDNPTTSLRGCNLLKYISEEFTTSKNVLNQERKNELKKLLLQEVPTIIQVLIQFLGQLFDQNAEKKFKHNNLLSYPVGSPDTNTYTGSFNTQTKTLTTAAFDALLSYFSWIPLNELLTPALLDILFKYLRLEMNGTPALICLNEILSKNCVPKGFEEFLMRIFHQIYSLLTDITNTSNGSAGGANNNTGSFRIGHYTIDTIQKFTQFIQLFVSNHLKRVENNPNFPISDFLSLLYRYSFIQKEYFDSFLSCIDIWSTFLDFLINQTTENGIPPPQKYSDGLLLFQSELVKCILFSYSKDSLNDIDDMEEELDDELHQPETKLNSYIKKCIETVSKVTELYPVKSIENLFPLFTQIVTSFFGKAEEIIKHGMSMDNQDNINYLVKDVITILKLFARLSDQFVVNFVPNYNVANFIFQKLLEMCSFSITHYTFNNGSFWIDLQVQLIETIRSFSFWLSEYGNQVRAVPNQQTEFDNNISKLIGIIGRLFERNIPESISIASGKLLMSLVIISKPLNLFTQMETENIFGNIHNICNPLPTSVQCIIYSAISSTILNPPSNVNLSHQWDIRRPKYSPFIKGITSPYLEIPQIPNFIDNKLYTKDEEIIKTVPDVSTAKGILHDGIQDTLHVTLVLLQCYIGNPTVLESILDFFFSLFESLKTQVGIAFTQQTITTFIDILGGDNIKQLLARSDEIGNTIIKKLIEIFIFVIQTQGHSFDSLLVSIINFSMEKIYPCIINSTSSVRPIFFTLLYTILDNHWKYFFSANSTPSSPESVHLNSILLAFQSTFQQNDVNLFKQNLDYFEKLNKSHKLYEKITLQESIFGCSFVGIFFDVLVSKSQSILTEDISNTIYNFATINFHKFFNEFFNAYLIQKKQLTNEQKSLLRVNFTEDKDHPTFSRNMIQFINDFSFYTFINS